jgi:hypothetical protein
MQRYGAALDIVLNLRKHSIQARPLGNVLYLMCAPTTVGLCRLNQVDP